MIRRPPRSTLFPYTRSSDLLSQEFDLISDRCVPIKDNEFLFFEAAAAATGVDRKSTRLNSSHGYISYAVFCLKKKKKTIFPHSHEPLGQLREQCVRGHTCSI